MLTHIHSFKNTISKSQSVDEVMSKATFQHNVSQLNVYVLLASLFPNFGDPPPSRDKLKKLIKFSRRKKAIEVLGGVYQCGVLRWTRQINNPLESDARKVYFFQYTFLRGEEDHKFLSQSQK